MNCWVTQTNLWRCSWMITYLSHNLFWRSNDGVGVAYIPVYRLYDWFFQSSRKVMVGLIVYPNQNARETELFDWQNRLERGNQYLKDDFLPICIYIVLALTDFKRETCDESHDGRLIFYISMKTRWRRRLENETKTYPLVYGQVWKILWVAIPTAVYLFNFSDHSGRAESSSIWLMTENTKCLLCNGWVCGEEFQHQDRNPLDCEMINEWKLVY